jgi:1,4-dihydroxy-2-naphthoate octaprenyltransferase
MGSWYVLTGMYDHPPMALGLALGLLAAAMCHAGHLYTLADDVSSKNHTAAVLLGWEGARRLYYVLTSMPYLLVLIGLMVNLLPAWTWLTFCSAPLTARGVLAVWRATPEQVQDLVVLDRWTAHAYLGFGLSLALGLLLGYVS